MKNQRPSNPGVGRSRRAPTAKNDTNPWEHDIELVEVLNPSSKQDESGSKIGAKKLLYALEGKLNFNKVGLKLPSIVKDPAVQAMKKHPLAQDQGKYMRSNLRRFNKKKTESIDENNPVFSRAVGDLPETKQQALLLTLSKISKSLEFGGLSIEEDATMITSTNKSTNNIDRLNKPHLGDNYDVDDDQSVARSIASQISSMQSSVMSNYTNAKSYGKSSINSEHIEAMDTLNRLGMAMHEYPDLVFEYSRTTGRGKQGDLAAPTEIMARMAKDFKVYFSTYDMENIMKKFDVENLGIASLGAILGTAKLVYSKTVYKKQMDEIQVFADNQKKELAEKRAEYKAKLGSKELDGALVEGSIKRDYMKAAIEKMAQASYCAMRARAMKSLNTCRAKISSKDFRMLLKELNCELLPREVSMMERRYYISSTGSIDAWAFKQEFVALGKDIIRERMRAEALQSFLKTLSHTNHNEFEAEPLPPTEGKDDVGNKAHFESKDDVLSADNGTIEENMDEQDLKDDEDLDEFFEKKASNHLSIEMAEEWIADPLLVQSPKKIKHVKILEKNASKMLDGLLLERVTGSDDKEGFINNKSKSGQSLPITAVSTNRAKKRAAHMAELEFVQKEKERLEKATNKNEKLFTQNSNETTIMESDPETLRLLSIPSTHPELVLGTSNEDNAGSLELPFELKSSPIKINCNKDDGVTLRSLPKSPKNQLNPKQAIISQPPKTPEQLLSSNLQKKETNDLMVDFEEKRSPKQENPKHEPLSIKDSSSRNDGEMVGKYGGLEEFVYDGTDWAKYESEGLLYYLDCESNHSQYDDPRHAGIIVQQDPFLDVVQVVEDEEKEYDPLPYDLGIHEIQIPTRRKNTADDDNVLLASSSWQPSS